MLYLTQASDLPTGVDPLLEAFSLDCFQRWPGDWAPDDWRDYGLFCVVEEGDNVAVAGCLPFALLEHMGSETVFAKCPEWVTDHGTFYEVAIITGDAGDFVVVLVPKNLQDQSDLLSCCSREAAPAEIVR